MPFDTAMEQTSEALTIDGRRYLSVKVAATLADYTADYVGQLCRAGKIIATRIGRAWYVEESSLIAHKEAQVLKAEEVSPREEASQSPARRPTRTRISPRTIFKESSFIVYHKDDRPLMPELISTPPEEVSEVVFKEAPVVEKQPVAVPQQPVFTKVPKTKAVSHARKLEHLDSFFSAFGRAFAGTVAFAAVFLLIFSLNGTYTRGLISDAFDGAVASVQSTQAAATINSELIDPYRFVALEISTFIDTQTAKLLYGVSIYEETPKE